VGARLTEFREQVRLQFRLEQLMGRREARTLLRRFREISRRVESPHNGSHVLAFAVACCQRRDLPGVLVEAGCFKGSSTAKFSLVAELIGKKLVVFDSFQGLPRNVEPHDRTINGRSIAGWFDGGNFRGTLDEVRENLARYGSLDACELIQGWFEDTVSSFGQPVSAAYLDVDLASSTRTCLRHLFPLLVDGGSILSQDGDFPLVIDVLGSDRFWRDEVGCEPPEMEGLGTSKVITIHRGHRGSRPGVPTFANRQVRDH
jgi:O-methyltransferase